MKKIFDWIARRMVYHTLVRGGMKPEDATRKVMFPSLFKNNSGEEE